MNSVMNIALSGMQAAVVRASASANNIANARSSSSIVDNQVVKGAFIPQDVIQISDPNGGTSAFIQPSGATPLTTTDLTSGATIQIPNVDLGAELVKIQQASVDYSANLKVTSYSSAMQKSLVDIFV